jgi:hypothetical protein
MTDEYRDVPNGYAYLYEQQGWVVVERGDFTTRMRKAASAGHSSPPAAPANISVDHT